MSKFVSWMKYIYSIYNPAIRKLSYILCNYSEHKVGILITSIFIFVVFLFLLTKDPKTKYPKTKQNNDNKNKLFVLTEFNTIINKFMPIDVDDFGRETYLKILGPDFPKIYPLIFSSRKKNKNKKNNLKVSFNENNINFMI